MAEKVTMWRVNDRLFDSEAEATLYERRQAMITRIEEFLYNRDVDRREAESVAVIISENLGWFRTVMDEAAAGIKAK